MTDKEFIIKASAEIETKNSFLKKETRKMAAEIKKLRKEIALQKKSGGLICSVVTNEPASLVLCKN